MIIFMGNERTINLYRDFVKEKRQDNKHIIVSCGYDQKLPETLINLYPSVNIHYGILPRYAGFNPIYWQMIEGDIAGVTLHYMDRNLDSGDIIDVTTIKTDTKTASEVFKELELEGLLLLKKHYQGIINNTAPRKKQNISIRKYRGKEDINFKKEILLGTLNDNILDDKKIRALSFDGKPYPVITIKNREYELVPKIRSMKNE